MNTTIDNSILNHIATKITEIGGEDPLSEAQTLLDASVNEEHLRELIHRRIDNHEPLAYIIGSCQFRGLKFKCDPRALIPRTETELLVEAGRNTPEGQHVIDVGTGGGAVSIALKAERPDLYITAVDISKDALDLASVNCAEHNLFIALQHGDLLKGIKGDYYTVLANLPYLPESRRDSFLPEMIDNEPQVALWGGDDGFNLIRELLSQVQKKPKVKLLAIEVGRGMFPEGQNLVRAAGFGFVYGIEDRRGDARVVVGKR